MGGTRRGPRIHIRINHDNWFWGNILMPRKQEKVAKNIYHIRVQGDLDQKWADWFDDFVMVPRGNGETLLSGTAGDQAALHGLLGKIHGLGLPLLLLVQRDCPCTSKNCARRGDCQACAAYHNSKGNLPFCFRTRNRWDKQCTKLR
jgi:hypothetical protein